MPRTGTTYSAPASSWNPAVGGTQINVADWNALLGDLSTALTNSLTRGETTAYTLTLLDDATAAAAKATLQIEAAPVDVASAGTTDIGAAASNNVRITGTTTITSLGTASAGVWRFVRFAGALTLTHNATSLILPGVTNITTTANACATFLSLGSGNWICMDYQPAMRAGLLSKASRTSTSSITTGTPTIITWQQALDNELGAWSGGAATRLTVPSNVTRVMLNAQVLWGSSSLGVRVVSIKKNGNEVMRQTAMPLSGVSSDGAVVSHVDAVTSGDYFELEVIHSVGSSLNVESSITYFAMTALA